MAEARSLPALRDLQAPWPRIHPQILSRLCLLPASKVLSMPRLLSCLHHASRHPFQPSPKQQGNDPLPSRPAPEWRAMALLLPFTFLFKALAEQSYQTNPRPFGERLGKRPDGRLRPSARRRGDPGQPCHLICQSEPPRHQPSDVCRRILLAFVLWWRKSPRKELL